MVTVVDVNKPKPIYTVELTQDELDFLVSAAIALGSQGYTIANWTGKYRLKDEFKKTAVNLTASTLDRHRDKNAFIKIEDDKGRSL